MRVLQWRIMWLDCNLLAVFWGDQRTYSLHQSCKKETSVESLEIPEELWDGCSL
jgi:hypothetical protein